MEREQLCEVMVSEYVIEYIGYTALSLSAFRVDELCTSVKTALSAFAIRLLELGPSIFAQVELARHFSVGWDVILTDDQELLSYSADLYMFAGEAAHRISDSELDVLASNLMAALEEARISFGPCDRGQSNDGVFGMVVFWPEIPVLLQEYGAERLSVDTSWDEFLLDYYSV